MSALLIAGVMVAVAAAARSTWSPCGLSMLSTITPFGERARRHRYAATAGWFLAGAAAGGATLGAVAAALAAGVGAFDPPRAAIYGAGSVLALAAALVDAGAFGPLLPVIRRQVDDRWLARYRPWVYGAGFGWQIGVGFATYLMTAGVVLVLALAALTGSSLVALVLGVVFGLSRGSTVFLTARADTPAALRRLHSVLSRFEAPVRWAVAGVQAGAAAGLALVAGGAGGAGAAGAAGAVTGAVVAGACGVGALAGAVGGVRARGRAGARVPAGRAGREMAAAGTPGRGRGRPGPGRRDPGRRGPGRRDPWRRDPGRRGPLRLWPSRR